MELQKCIDTRKSIRKFSDEEVKKEDLKSILSAGLSAPSAKNMQNWHIVVLDQKEDIKNIADIVRKKHSFLINKINDEDKTKRFEKMIHYYTFFENAPVLVLVFASKYESSSANLLKEINLNKDYNCFLNASPGMQNIGALMENMLLMTHNLGYGGCWMTGPNFAIKEIGEYVSLDKEGFNLVAMTPIGVPADVKHPSPGKEGFEEKVTFFKK